MCEASFPVVLPEMNMSATVTHALVAPLLVIPSCDGYDAPSRYSMYQDEQHSRDFDARIGTNSSYVKCYVK